MNIRSIRPHFRKVHPFFLLSFLFLSGIPCVAQEPPDSTAAVDSSSGDLRFSPAIRAVQIDPAKIFHGHMWFNGDVDILRRGKSLSVGLRYQFYETGNFNSAPLGQSDCPDSTYSHQTVLAYASWYLPATEGKRSYVRLSLLAGADMTSKYGCSNNNSGPLDRYVSPTIGAELQVRLLGWLSVSAEYFFLPGNQDLMARALPVGIRLGYARW